MLFSSERSNWSFQAQQRGPKLQSALDCAHRHEWLEERGILKSKFFFFFFLTRQIAKGEHQFAILWLYNVIYRYRDLTLFNPSNSPQTAANKPPRLVFQPVAEKIELRKEHVNSFHCISLKGQVSSVLPCEDKSLRGSPVAAGTQSILPWGRRLGFFPTVPMSPLLLLLSTIDRHGKFLKFY